MTLFKPQVGNVKFSQTTRGFTVIIPNKNDVFRKKKKDDVNRNINYGSI